MGASMSVEFEHDTTVPLGPKPPLGLYVATDPIPMRLRICDRDLMAPDFAEEPGWAPLGLVGFVTFGLLSVRIVPRLGYSLYPLDESGETLLFKAAGERTLVHSTMTQVTVSVPFATLNNAWTSFANRVHDRFRAEHPEFAHDPIWQIADDIEAGLVETSWDRLYERETGGREHMFDSIDCIC
jgi:hypothetical protein